jgi:hypothetical protein
LNDACQIDFVMKKLSAINEDNMTVIRSKLTVGQELASSYALCQSRVADLASAAQWEVSVASYSRILSDEEGPAAAYVRLFYQTLDLDYDASADKVSELQKALSQLSEEGVHALAEGGAVGGKGPTPLQVARKDIPQEIR